MERKHGHNILQVGWWAKARHREYGRFQDKTVVIAEVMPDPMALR